MLRILALLTRPITAVFDRLMAVGHRRLSQAASERSAPPPARARHAAAAFAGSLALVPSLGVDLIPPFSQGEFSFKVQLPEGTPLEVTDRFVASLSGLLEEDETVESFSSIAGGAGLSLAATGTEGENTARIQVRMNPGSNPLQEEAVIARLRSRLAETEELRFDFERATFFSFRTPIEVEVYSDSIDELHEATRLVAEALADVPGLVDLRSSAEMGNPEVQVRFDREQLARLGLDLATVAQTVRTKVQGEVATRFTEGDREIDIRVRALEQGDAKVEDIHDLIVGHVDGRPIFLKSVARIDLTEGPTEIRRIGQKRAAVVGGNLSGRDMGAVAEDVRARLRTLVLPISVTAALSGQEEELQHSFRSLALAMGLAIFLVYLVMASQFESFLHPFVIIFTLPLGAIGVILALAITGHTINVVAIIGAVMLAGIVVNNAIVLIDAVNQRRRAGAPVGEALTDAGLARLRPILMTSATTIFGLLPMALGLGEGAELRAPLAVTVIGGLAVATALTLIVIPVVYSLLAGERIAQAAESPGSRRADRCAWCMWPWRGRASLPTTAREEREATMNLPTLAVRRPITTAMILVSVLLVGAIAFYRLPLAFLPTVDAPFIFVQIPYPNSHPPQIEKEITKPVEEILSTLSGVKNLNSTTSADGADFFMEFTWGQEIDVIRMKVSEKMDQVEPTLPPDIGPILIFSFNTNDIPVVQGRIAAEGVDLSQNYELLEARILNPLRRVNGVARVDLNGVEPRELFVDLILDKIKEHSVDVGGLAQLLQSVSSNLVLGRAESGGLRYTVRSLGAFESIESLANLVIDERGLRLGEVAEITYEEPPLTFGRHLDGKYAVALDVYKESTANTVEVVREVTRVVEEDINNDPLLKGIQLWVWQDQAEEITSGIDGLKKAGLTGALLATLSLYFFLRRTDSTVIVAMSIPFSIIATCGVMYFMGSTLNILSMMGLMLAVGMLVDNAIVVLESDRPQDARGRRPQERPPSRAPARS